MSGIPNHGPAVLAVTAVMISCSSLFVFFRLVSRIGIVKKIFLDDYFIIAAWIIAFGLSFCICDATRFGLGKHEYDIPAEQRYSLNRIDYAFTSLYNPALMVTKTSILIFFLTLAKQQRVFKWAVWGTIFIVNAAGLALSMINIFQCRPLSVIFDDIRPPTAHCIDIVTLYLSSAPVNIATDVIILLLPMPVLKSMHLPKRQKWILYITFGFGIFVAVVDVVRISYLQNAAVTRAEDALSGQAARNTQKVSDFSWYVAYSFMWSAVEVNVGIMIACVPALKPLVSRFTPQLIHDKVRSDRARHASNVTMNSMDMAAAHRVPSAVDLSAPEHPFNAQNAEQRPSTEMGLQEFLATPAVAEFSRNMERSPTAMTDTSGVTHRRPTTTFDFINMSESKGIVFFSNKEAVRPFTAVTVLFVLWGFAYGLLGGLNAQIQRITHESPGQAVGTHAAYYVGYAVAPLTFGRLALKYWGFKACYQIGLLVYGTGTLIFWPAAVLTSFPAFLITNFIIGMGLATLELAANPFIALCGPPENAEIRLNLSQAFQACGTVVANVLAKKALFKDVLDAPSLINVQWTYLAISLFTYAMSYIYYTIKLPEVTDLELEDSAEATHPETLYDLRRTNIIVISLILAAFSQFCYVGGQESIATSIESYIGVVSPGSSAINYEVIGQSLFAASRFLSAFLGLWITPRIHLAFFFAGAILFSALAMNFSGLTAGSMIMCVYFFEGPLFALIYAMPLRALGKYTKDGSVLLAASISGGSFFPAILYVVADLRHKSEQYALCVAVAAFAFGACFPIYANAMPKARLQLDPAKRLAQFREHPRATLSSIAKQVETITKGKRHSDSSPMDAKSSDDSAPSEGYTRDSPIPPEQGGRTAGIDWNAFHDAPVCSSGTPDAPKAVKRDQVPRSAADAPGTPIVTDFGAIDFGKYGRPSCPA
ncbi:MAG: hypothetical protein Q9162_007432 [Coniocarpon cinnabarinum]